MRTTFKNGTLTTNLPDGLKLVSKVVISKCVSEVHNGNIKIYHKPDTDNAPNIFKLKEHHKACLFEYIELAKGKDLHKPLNF